MQPSSAAMSLSIRVKALPGMMRMQRTPIWVRLMPFVPCAISICFAFGRTSRCWNMPPAMWFRRLFLTLYIDWFLEIRSMPSSIFLPMPILRRMRLPMMDISPSMVPRQFWLARTSSIVAIMARRLISWV